MRHSRKPLPCLGGSLAVLLSCILATSSRADLSSYVQKPEPSFAWKLINKKAVPQGTVYDLHLVSQVWEGFTWEHQLQIYQPTDVSPAATMLLFNTGGKPRP